MDIPSDSIEYIWQFISLDLIAILTALFSALACTLLGNFLLLRKLSLMGDAISHSVLPGIVIAFLITGSRASLPVFIGALIAGLVTALLVQLVQRYGRLDSSTSMGVVFSIMFALGVLLIEQASARSVDLDADCLLHGQLETIFWFPPQNLAEFFTFNTISLIPNELSASALVLAITIFFVWFLFKELKLVTFDPALASALGFNAQFLHYLMMLMVALAVVASFSAVGSILVIAMIIVPPATARLLTDRLVTQLVLSSVVTFIAVILGYLIAAFGPQLLGYSHSISAAGMIAVVAGIQLALAIALAPRYGLLKLG